MRWISAVVTGKGLDARDPAADRGVMNLDGHEARCELSRLGPLERALQQLEAWEDDHVDRRVALAHHPVGLRQASLDRARLARGCVHGARDLIAAQVGRFREYGLG